MTDKPTAIALLSGGLDSIVATRLAMEQTDVVAALTFDYGQRAYAREGEIAERACEEWGIEFRSIELPWLAEWTDTALVARGESLPEISPDKLDVGADDRARRVWVPNRNGSFVAVAAAFAESTSTDSIVMGLNAEEAAAFPDNSEAFLKATNEALALSTLKGVRLESPTVGMTKSEIAREFMRLDIDPGLFWCCYEGGESLCGRCESCARAIRAFKAAGGWDLVSHRFESKG
jgi:7-cyano-7-deazaguanine synthase